MCGRELLVIDRQDVAEAGVGACLLVACTGGDCASGWAGGPALVPDRAVMRAVLDGQPCAFLDL